MDSEEDRISKKKKAAKKRTLYTFLNKIVPITIWCEKNKIPQMFIKWFLKLAFWYISE